MKPKRLPVVIDDFFDTDGWYRQYCTNCGDKKRFKYLSCKEISVLRGNKDKIVCAKCHKHVYTWMGPYCGFADELIIIDEKTE